MSGKTIGSSLHLLLEANSFPGWAFDLSLILMLRPHSMQWWQVRPNKAVDTEWAVGYLDGSVLWDCSLLFVPCLTKAVILC